MKSLEPLLAACGKLKSPQATKKVQEASRAFFDELLVGDAPTLPKEALLALETLPPHGASWLAILMGTAVDEGADPTPSAEAQIKLLRAWLDQLPLVDPYSEALPKLTATQKTLTEALGYLCQSLVAHLAKLPERRQSLADDIDFLNQLGNAACFNHAPLWLLTLLERRSGTLVIFHGAARRGMRLRYENVGNCFHLFSLIQAAVGTKLPDGQEPDEEVAMAARGLIESDAGDQAWWHYGNPTAQKPLESATIQGDTYAHRLPQIDGEKTILLWPPQFGDRFWGAEYFEPLLEPAPPKVTIEKIFDDKENEAWAAKIFDD